jgi:hypothetical protein
VLGGQTGVEHGGAILDVHAFTMGEPGGGLFSAGHGSDRRGDMLKALLPITSPRFVQRTPLLVAALPPWPDARAGQVDRKLQQGYPVAERIEIDQERGDVAGDARLSVTPRLKSAVCSRVPCLHQCVAGAVEPQIDGLSGGIADAGRQSNPTKPRARAIKGVRRRR